MNRPLRLGIWLVGAGLGHMVLTLLLMTALLLLNALLIKSIPNLGGLAQVLLTFTAAILIPLPTSILLYNLIVRKLQRKAWFRKWLS